MENKSLNVLKDCAIVVFRANRPGNVRKVPKEKFNINADKSMVSMSKKLLKSPEYKDIARLDSQTGRFIKRQCLPVFIEDGLWLLPKERIETVYEQVKSYETLQRPEMIEKFRVAYPQRVEEARSLGDLYSTADYPDWQKVAAAYRVTFRVLSCDVPDALADREVAWLQDLAEQARDGLREIMAELVGHLLDRLTPGNTGDQKVLREGTVKKLSEFLGEFQTLNKANDGELAGLVLKASSLLQGVTSQSLKNSETARDKVRNGLAEIKTTLDTQLIRKPDRVYDLDDDEEKGEAA